MFVMPCVALSVDRQERFHRLLRNAINDVRMTLLQAAQEAEKDVRHFARILDGQSRALDVLTKQPDAFWQALGENIVAEFGISRRARLAAKLRGLVRGKKRQARMIARRQERQRA